MSNAGEAATFVIGRFGLIEDVDDNACRLVGYDRSELLRLHGADLILPEDRPTVAVTIDRMRQATINRRRGRLLRKDRGVVEVDVQSHLRPKGELVLIIRSVSSGTKAPPQSARDLG